MPTPKMMNARKALEDHIEEWGYPQTQTELARELNCSVSAVHQLLSRMQNHGLVKLGRGWRNIEICGKPDRKPRQLEAA